MDKQLLLQAKIDEWGIAGVDIELVTLALTHPSYNADGKNNNQRLEFLGDAVLGMILGGISL